MTGSVDASSIRATSPTGIGQTADTRRAPVALHWPESQARPGTRTVRSGNFQGFGGSAVEHTPSQFYEFERRELGESGITVPDGPSLALNAMVSALSTSVIDANLATSTRRALTSSTPCGKPKAQDCEARD